MLKEMIFKKILKSQMRGVPEAEQEKVLKMVTENPELFKKIAEDIDKKIKGGKDKMSATMEVMQSYRNELEKLV